MYNTIFLKDIKNYTFNFKKILKQSNSLVLKNCNNLTIKIKSKINKITLIKCKNIKIIMNDAIIGVEFYKSKNINFNVLKNINSFESFNSNVNGKIKNKKSVFYQSESSKINLKSIK